MGAEILVQIEPVDQADHDLRKGQILFEALVGNAEERLTPGGAEEFEVSWLQGGHRTVHESGMVGDAVDGLTIGDGFGDFCLRSFLVALLFVKVRTLFCP